MGAYVGDGMGVFDVLLNDVVSFLCLIKGSWLRSAWVKYTWTNTPVYFAATSMTEKKSSITLPSEGGSRFGGGPGGRFQSDEPGFNGGFRNGPPPPFPNGATPFRDGPPPPFGVPPTDSPFGRGGFWRGGRGGRGGPPGLGFRDRGGTSPLNFSTNSSIAYPGNT